MRLKFEAFLVSAVIRGNGIAYSVVKLLDLLLVVVNGINLITP